VTLTCSRRAVLQGVSLVLIGEMNESKILVGKPEWNRTLIRHRRNGIVKKSYLFT
jgi:hypothetical protein